MTIKDSGKRREFDSGAQRDRGDLKPRPDLIHPYFMMRFGLHMAKGAKKYSDWNWAKGMPVSEYMASAQRHIQKAMIGMADEDHLAAAAFNIMGAMVTQRGAEIGVYDESMNDINHFSKLWEFEIEDLEKEE